MNKRVSIVMQCILVLSLVFGVNSNFANAASNSTTKIIETLKKQVQTLTATIKTKDKQINTFKGQLATANKQVATLKSQVSTRDGQISSLKVEVDSKNNEINRLNAQIKSLNDQINPPGPKPKSMITKSDLPYTHKAKNGMQLTINSYTADTSGVKINMTITNTSSVSDKGELMTSTWELFDGKTTLKFLDQDDLFWDTNYLRAGQSVTGDVIFKGLTQTTDSFDLYGKLWQYIDAEDFKLTFKVE
jgi:cell division protein FtsB